MKLPLNTTGIYRHEGLRIPVNVLEVKNTYGRTRYTITPIGGRGTATKEDVELADEHKHLLELL